MTMLVRPIAVALLFVAVSAIPSYGTEPFNLSELQKAYAANNRDDLPLVSWMDWGMPKFLLYPDGSLLAEDLHSKSRLAIARLSGEELNDVLKKLSATDAFWLLSPSYELTKRSDHPQHVITVRIPGKSTFSVSVYGNLSPKMDDEVQPPPAFLGFIAALSSVTPERMVPWDPGYVEIIWADYGYAPDPSLPWPEEWPGLNSPFARHGDDLIKAILVFPSSHLKELDAFLARRRECGAILINGKKMSGHYRWPLPGEKKWSSWTW